jgi:hypothetical protein
VMRATEPPACACPAAGTIAKIADAAQSLEKRTFELLIRVRQ